MKIISLPHGKTTVVDDGTWDWAKDFKWCLNAYGYVITGRGLGKNKKMFLHRKILNATKGQLVDHIDRNPLNNLSSNLRICEHRENLRNRPKPKGATTSRFKGVHMPSCKRGAKRPWVARIMVNYKNLSLGCHASEEEAAMAYNKGALKYFGEFAFLNPL